MPRGSRAQGPTGTRGTAGAGGARQGGAEASIAPQLPGYAEFGLPEEVGFLARMARLAVLTNLVFDQIVEPFGLGFNDYLVLGVIRRSPGGRSSPVLLCRVLGRTTGGMTLTLDRLAANGWVRRSPNPDDRRRVIVTLTPVGRQLSLDVNAALHAWEVASTQGDARKELLDAADQLLAAVSPGAPETEE